ncbi:hypothetical protein SO802_034850 [Lithocarpus litseifolius]|uniref:Small ribosomal subunit protein uS7 domain-containing protein n=1 Tax=Lithocarpus litseifolius TaxID=425828 RepID=A0AAW2BAA0_9ROSI
MNENVTESVLVTLRGGVEEGRRFSNEEKDPTTSKELNEEPYEDPHKEKHLPFVWLLGASRKRPGRNMAFKLSSELVDAAKGSGDAIRKKEETHRMAEANRAFAHFR